MKKIIFWLMIFTGLYLSACKKTSNDSSGNGNILMTVKEYKTNIPLPGVQISLYKCTNYDNVFGCRAKSVFASHVTDAKGEYRFVNGELNLANEGVTIKKSKYFDGGGGQGERFMVPRAWVDIHLTTQTDYPDTSNFQITATNGMVRESVGPFRPPKDSTIRLSLAGNDINQVGWSVFYRDPKCYFYCPPDIFASGSFSITAAKFETLKYELAY